MKFFKLPRTKIAIGRMKPEGIVIRFDVFENLKPCLFPGAVRVAVDLFYLQRMIKAFHGGIIIAIPAAAHATPDCLGL